jgi:hypothetical protein
MRYVHKDHKFVLVKAELEHRVAFFAALGNFLGVSDYGGGSIALSILAFH